MAAAETAGRAFVNLLRDHPSLARPLLELTRENLSEMSSAGDGPTALGSLRDAVRTGGDSDAIDAALRAVIRQAQAARKALKS